MRIPWWVALMGCAGVLAMAGMAAHLAGAGKAPKLRCLSEFDLGSRDQGEIVVVPFDLANDGDAPLAIQGVRTNCACTGLEVLDAGEWKRVASLLLSPGEVRQARLRLQVNADLGSSGAVGVFLRTNAPGSEEHRILLRLGPFKRGVFADPPTLTLRGFKGGPPPTASVRLLDDRNRRLKLTKVECGHSAVVSTISAAHGSSEDAPERLGEIAFQAATGAAVHQDTVTFVYLEGMAEPLRIPTALRIEEVVRLEPSIIAFPPLTAETAAREVVVAVRCSGAAPKRMVLRETPMQLKALVEESSADREGPFRLRIARSADSKNGDLTKAVIRLTAELNDGKVDLELPVLLRRQ